MATEYHVGFDPRAKKTLDKMDGSVRRLIVAYIAKHLEGCEDPRVVGEGLTENKAGQWRYRVGDYRLLAVIKESELIIYIFKVAHRSVAYKEN